MSVTIIQIEEIQEKLTQGFSGVHRCLGEDGNCYYTKGYQVERIDQAKEWICANLAQRFGLPIAKFALVEVNEGLYQVTKNKDLRDLGYGICFGSQEVEHAAWLEPNKNIEMVSDSTRADILVFDWWIKNLDRTPNNPNLLWVPGEQRVVVIDHNLAFDPEATEDAFFQSHIFRGEKERIFGDLFVRQEYEAKMAVALEGFQSAVDVIDKVWQWEDLEESRPFTLDSQALLATLEEYKTPEFWRTK